MSYSLFKPPLPGSHKKITFGNLVGSSAALLISNIARETKKSLLIITPDSVSAQRLELEMRFFAREFSELILNFPDWETLPYDIFSPHQDIISQRIKGLYQLYAAKAHKQRENVLITPITSLMHKLPPVEYFSQHSFMLNVGDRLHSDTFRLQLQKNGYYAVQQVFSHGEFSFRGSIMDIFPMGSQFPIRVDLLGDEVDSIRVFDPESQLSTSKITSIEMLPAHEFPLSDEGITTFRQSWRNHFAGNPLNCPVYQSVSDGVSSPGIEYYLPLFFEKTSTLFDYLSDDTLVFVAEDCHSTSEKFWQEIKERYEQRRYDVTHPILDPSQLFLSTESLFGSLKNFSQIYLTQKAFEENDRDHTVHPPFEKEKDEPLIHTPFEKEKDEPVIHTPFEKEKDEPLIHAPFEKEKDKPVIHIPFEKEKDEPLIHAPFEKGGSEHQRKLVEAGDLIKKNSLDPHFQRGHFDFHTENLPDLTMDYRQENPLKKLAEYVNNESLRSLLVAETSGRREVLLDMLHKANLYPTVCQDWQDFLDRSDNFCLTVAPMDRGFNLPSPESEGTNLPLSREQERGRGEGLKSTPISLITESQLLGQQIMQRRLRRHKKSNLDAIVRDLAELNIGSPVVHIDHGIGRYIGLQTITLDNVETEFLTVEYKGGDKLYVPVASLHLISRYTGFSENAPLNRLGTDHWQNTKRKAAEQIRDVAAELLEIYAKREANVGFAFKQLDGDYERFSAGFPFELTLDQQQAIDAVIKDMQSPRPMDRVICGDVGFGKTEVAMRAAFIAAMNNKQVAILVPTTLLAQQHYQNFCDRFADWPIQIEVISRFRTKKEQDEILKKLTDKKIDILIGTHKLLQAEIEFDKLGLLVIDEEHRFGVQQKEKFKSFRSEVDILTLTATPIPRTLNMAFSGLRELSIIATPPARRLSVKTFVHEKNNLLIQEAVLRELLRGGQVYVVHNDVQTIENAADEIRRIVPEARVNVAHGQMREKELEHIMADFYHQRFNVLVCTTIIETGIDVPTANTMIIDRADKFGLAQLHQLRGRVGRSHHQAYAYLIIPPEAALGKDAKKRLEAIAMFEELGAGFALATHDLEIRGAGELLGEEQSGNMHAIGFSLYTELLELAIASEKKRKLPSPASGATTDSSLSGSGESGTNEPLSRQRERGRGEGAVNLPTTKTEADLKIPALIPDNYVGDVHLRLTFYKRLSETTQTNQIDDIQVEMIDRFGLFPFQTKNLFQITHLKVKAGLLGITRIEAAKNGGFFEFTESPSINPDRIIEMLSGPIKFCISAQVPFEKENDLNTPHASFEKGGSEAGDLSIKNPPTSQKTLVGPLFQRGHEHSRLNACTISFKMEGPTRLRFLFDQPIEGENRIVIVEKILESFQK